MQQIGCNLIVVTQIPQMRQTLAPGFQSFATCSLMAAANVKISSYMFLELPEVQNGVTILKIIGF